MALGTLILAAVAVFQETIRGWFYRPKFMVLIKSEPPDCHAVPITSNGTFIANSIYLRIWIKNIGNATAKNAEVYAEDLQRQRADGTWERVVEFPPMNLKWANIGKMYFPVIAPEMGKHCDIGQIVNPSRSDLLSLPDFECGLTRLLKKESGGVSADLASDRWVTPRRPFCQLCRFDPAFIII